MPAQLDSRWQPFPVYVSLSYSRRMTRSHFIWGNTYSVKSSLHTYGMQGNTKPYMGEHIFSEEFPTYIRHAGQYKVLYGGTHIQWRVPYIHTACGVIQSHIWGNTYSVKSSLHTYGMQDNTKSYMGEHIFSEEFPTYIRHAGQYKVLYGRTHIQWRVPYIHTACRAIQSLIWGNTYSVKSSLHTYGMRGNTKSYMGEHIFSERVPYIHTACGAIQSLIWGNTYSVKSSLHTYSLRGNTKSYMGGTHIQWRVPYIHTACRIIQSLIWGNTYSVKSSLHTYGMRGNTKSYMGEHIFSEEFPTYIRHAGQYKVLYGGNTYSVKSSLHTYGMRGNTKSYMGEHIFSEEFPTYIRHAGQYKVLYGGTHIHWRVPYIHTACGAIQSLIWGNTYSVKSSLHTYSLRGNTKSYMGEHIFSEEFPTYIRHARQYKVLYGGTHIQRRVPYIHTARRAIQSLMYGGTHIQWRVPYIHTACGAIQSLIWENTYSVKSSLHTYGMRGNTKSYMGEHIFSEEFPTHIRHTGQYKVLYGWTQYSVKSSLHTYGLQGNTKSYMGEHIFSEEFPTYIRHAGQYKVLYGGTHIQWSSLHTYGMRGNTKSYMGEHIFSEEFPTYIWHAGQYKVLYGGTHIQWRVPCIHTACRAIQSLIWGNTYSVKSSLHTYGMRGNTKSYMGEHIFSEEFPTYIRHAGQYKVLYGGTHIRWRVPYIHTACGAIQSLIWGNTYSVKSSLHTYGLRGNTKSYMGGTHIQWRVPYIHTACRAIQSLIWGNTYSVKSSLHTYGMRGNTKSYMGEHIFSE